MFTYIIIFACVVCLTEISANQLESLDENTIKDIGFDTFGYYNNRFNDYIVIGLLLVYLFKGKDHAQFIKLAGILFALRVIFMNLTVLPATHSECKNQSFLPFTGKCRDLVFSGHTAIATLVVLFLIQEGVINTLFGGVVITILGVFTLMARHHYTLDIVLGVLASITVFNLRDKITF
jgi:phosphatidylglycerophosphate synthase